MKRAAVLLAILAFGSCRQESADDGHAHAEGETWTVTAWGDTYEVLSETGPLAVGRETESYVHVTVLHGLAPLREGRVSILLTEPGGETRAFAAEAPARDGISAITLRPEVEGEHTQAFRIEAPSGTETIPGGTVRVGSPENPSGLVRSPHEIPPATGEPVAFLKEQQWQTAFATQPVERGRIRSSVQGPARVRPAAGGEVLLTAPFDAVLARAPWPWPGRGVRAGETVLRLVPRAGAQRSLAVLEAEVRTLEADARLAAERAERLEQLLAAEATSRAERDRGRAEAGALEARLDAARADLDNARAARTGARAEAALALSAPWTAQVAEVRVTPGEAVAAGAPLVRLVRPRPVWLEVALSPEDAAQLTAANLTVHLRRPGSPEPISLDPGEVRLVAKAPEIDRRTATRAVLLELERDADELPLGTSAQAELVLDESLEGIVISDTSLVDDGGKTIVYVQLEGESFARREADVLAREGRRVLVDGLSEGERLVSVGGSAIRRTTLLGSGTAPDHVH
jgi:RND family efflux transporter MFP subunit